MKALLLIFICALLLADPPGSALGADRIVLQDKDAVIEVDRPYEVAAQQLQRSIPDIKLELVQALGWKLRMRPTIVLVADRAAFELMSGGRFISAFALPQRQLVVIHLTRATAQPYVIRETLKHELCHLLLHDYIRGPHIPKWLDEGVCQWVSGSLGEVILGLDGTASLPPDISSRAIPLSRLDYSFPTEEQPLLLAYEESRSFVDYLSAQYGRKGLLGLLTLLGQGQGIEQAVVKSLGKPIETVEQEWRANLEARGLWWIWISRYFYELLFLMAAILTIVAFVRLAIRKRKYDEEESAELPGGGPDD